MYGGVVAKIRALGHTIGEATCQEQFHDIKLADVIRHMREAAVWLKTRRRWRSEELGGVFARRAHSANYSVVYPRKTPENHLPTEACMIHSKQHRGCRIQDPGSHGKHQTKEKSLVYQQGLQGL